MKHTLVVLAALGLAGPAHAADHPHDAVKLLLRAVPTGQRLVWISRAPALAFPSTCPADATLRVANGAASASMPLPASGWSRNDAGTVCRFRNREAPDGGTAVKLALLKAGRQLKVSARGAGLVLDPALAGPVAIELAIAGDRYCARCDTAARSVTGLYLARGCPAPADCELPPPPTSTSSTSTTTTSTSSTSSTTAGPRCCARTRLTFVSGAASGSCGTVQNSAGTVTRSLLCGVSYLGGGNSSVPPSVLPDLATSHFAITACDAASGELTLGATTPADTGNLRTCTSAGCLVGAPVAIAKELSPPTSLCGVQVVAGSPSGGASCATGDVDMTVPIATHLYLSGDLLPDPGVQPCPLCQAGTCRGGPNDGLPCAPGSTAVTTAYPTSHDCPPMPGDYMSTLSAVAEVTTGTRVWTAQASTFQQRIFCGYCRDGDSGFGSGEFEHPPRPCAGSHQCPNAPFLDCQQRNNGAFGPGGGAAKTITATGSAAGDLSDGASHAATLASLACVPPTFNATIDAAADLPGPVAAAVEATLQLTP